MTTKQLPWEDAFLAALSHHGIVAQAAREVGIGRSTVITRRKNNADFARRFRKAMPPRKVRNAALAESRRPGPDKPPVHWRSLFLEALIETSNVNVSAARANVPTAKVYKTRREQAEFARKWRAALREGYDNLEIELLGHLRDPQGERKMDVAAAVRLLAAHRATVERERALEGEEDVEAVRASIDRFIRGIRANRAANAPLTIEAKPGDEE